MEPKAIPLIVFEKGEFQVTAESLEFLSSIKGKIGVIAVVGKYRTGKSFLLNRIILDNKGKVGFGVGPTINPCTKGLWIWSEGVEIDQDGEKITVLVIDSEGLGAFDEDANHDTRIFLLALLLSSYFIYNSVGSIDESALQNLSLIVNLSKQIQAKSAQSTLDGFSEYFPSFLWVLRDFALKLVDNQGNTISTREYLENALAPTKGISDSVEAKNRIRRLLLSFFKDRDCFALVRPTESEKALQRLDQADENVFRPEFLQLAQKLRRHIFRKVKVKMVNKAVLNGEMLGNLARTYVETINKGGVPNIEGAWSQVCQAECLKAVDECVGEFDKDFRSCVFPLSEVEFKQKTKELFIKATNQFKGKAIGDNSEQYLQQLLGKLKDRKIMYLQRNARTQEEKVQRSIQDWLIEIMDKIRNLEISNYQDFKELKILFTKNLLEGLSFEVKIKAYEALAECQQTVSDILTKNTTTELQNEVRKVTAQLELVSDQFQRKKSDFESEKDYFKSKIDELEKDCSLHRGNSAVLNARNEELQNQKKRIEEAHEEKLSNLKEKYNEKFSELKEKNQKMMTKFSESETKYTKDLADLQKENLLLKQELEFKTNEIANLKERNDDLERLLRETRKRPSIEEFDKKEDQTDWSSERKLLKSQIESLKAHIEDNKSIQEALMTALNSKNAENPQHIDKAYETNKHLSFALDKSEENCKKLEQKVQKSKKFQKMVKNSSSLQCRKCLKNQSLMNFLQHVSNCEGIVKETNTLILSIVKTVIKEVDNKPCTEYVISVSVNGKISTVLRKYKNFCNLHQSMQNMFPHFDLPDLFPALETPSRVKLMEERRKNFENYLVQLSQVQFIKESVVFRRFIGLEGDGSGKFIESPLKSKRVKSNIELITSRAFSPSRSVLSPLNSGGLDMR